MHLQALAADICAYSGNEGDNRDLYSLLESKIEEMQIDPLIMYNKKAGDKSSTINFIHVGWTVGLPEDRNCSNDAENPSETVDFSSINNFFEENSKKA